MTTQLAPKSLYYHGDVIDNRPVVFAIDVESESVDVVIRDIPWTGDERQLPVVTAIVSDLVKRRAPGFDITDAVARLQGYMLGFTPGQPFTLGSDALNSLLNSQQVDDHALASFKGYVTSPREGIEDRVFVLNDELKSFFSEDTSEEEDEEGQEGEEEPF